MFFKSSADVFRTKQALADLKYQVATVPPDVFARIAANGNSVTAADILRHIADGGVFTLPRDDQMLSAVLLSAALPDDDHLAFVVATSLLLIDRLADGGGRDDLYWNWDAFADHVRIGPDTMRAAIMCGFRALATARGLELSHPPSEADCLTQPDFAPPAEYSPEEAGALWQSRAQEDRHLSGDERALFRHLAERDQGMAPPDPDLCPAVPPLVP